MTQIPFFELSIGLFLIGLVLIFVGRKRDKIESNELPSILQWGYLLILIGLFGSLSQFMSFTAVLLIFVVLTGICYILYRVKKKQLGEKIDSASNHSLEYLQGFFPIILIVFVIRTFIVEPFIIPSSSMRPGLVVGDFVLVNKFTYGIRTPILNNVIIPINKIQNGDILVFNYPQKPSISYIKRVIGIPGDKVEYKDKKLIINDKPVETIFDGEAEYTENSYNISKPYQIKLDQYTQIIGDKKFHIYIEPDYPPLDLNYISKTEKTCEFNKQGFTCQIPDGKYLVLGDNRDHSEDGRYWGFVDDTQVIGKGFFIWMNLKHLNRIGTVFH